MRQRFLVSSFLASCALVVLTTAGGCSSTDGSDFGDGGADGSAATDSGVTPCFGPSCTGGGGAADAKPQCVGLQCQVNQACSGGGHTSISGKVFDPAGKNPLYNVVVYVPSDPAGKLPPITTGTNSCNTCDTSIDNIVAATLTDETGSFTLKDVPTGKQIPLVMQIGKWRREVFLPQTTDCADTPAPAAATRLPRNKTEGDMPQMAVLTGGCDTLACLFRRIGIDDAEFTAPSGNGRMHVYKGVGGADVTGGGAGNCTNASCPLWSSKAALEKYDVAILSCECNEKNNTKGGTTDPAPSLINSPQMTAMHNWINEGGKAFATHYHYTWFKNNAAAPEWNATAKWVTGGADTTEPYTIDTTFPKGQSFVKWMNNLNALSAQPDKVGLSQNDVRDDITSLNPGKGALRWIYSAGQSPKYISFNTPIGGVPGGDAAAPTYCGKAVFSDIHVSADNSAGAVPSTCGTGDLTPQEKALEFLFFDLSACVQNDQQPPQPPQPR